MSLEENDELQRELEIIAMEEKADEVRCGALNTFLVSSNT